MSRRDCMGPEEADAVMLPLADPRFVMLVYVIFQ